MIPTRLVIAAVLCASLGCAENVPQDPTWFGDVQKILAANCMRCHGEPAKNNAPATFRLDRYVANDADPDALLAPLY